jgi:REP element-mobilizing transposase RayT
VWTTKNRIPYLTKRIRVEVISHIYTNAKIKGIYINQINGYDEHLHSLISLGGSQNISDVMQKIKGESSYWINRNKLTREKFEWQDDFYCVSVGQSHLDNLRRYILNQEQHHMKVKWEEELEILIKEYNLLRMRD